MRLTKFLVREDGSTDAPSTAHVMWMLRGEDDELYVIAFVGKDVEQSPRLTFRKAAVGTDVGADWLTPSTRLAGTVVRSDGTYHLFYEADHPRDQLVDGLTALVLRSCRELRVASVRDPILADMNTLLAEHGKPTVELRRDSSTDRMRGR